MIEFLSVIVIAMSLSVILMVGNVRAAALVLAQSLLGNKQISKSNLFNRLVGVELFGVSFCNNFHKQLIDCW